MSKNGRPSKFNKTVAEKIVAGIRKGLTLGESAERGGVTYGTLRNWLRKGEEAKSGQLFDFYDQVKEAETEAHLVWLEQVNDGWSDASVKQVIKDGRVVAEHKEVKQKRIDPLRWLIARYPHRYGQHAVKELAGEALIEEFFLVIEERHGKDFADRHRDLYDQGLAGEALESEGADSQRNPFRKPIMGF